MATLPSEIAVEVIASARRGDRDAHAAIYRHYADTLFTLIYRLVVRRALAEDVLQEVFLEVIRHLHSYSGQGSFGGWLRSIAVNRSLSHLRSPWYSRFAALNEEEGSFDELSTQDRTLPLDEALTAQRDLERALAQLPAISRAVVWLHDVEGYTHQEIAAALGRTPSFSKSQLARAHQKLRQLLSTTDQKPIAETLPCTSVSTIY